MSTHFRTFTVVAEIDNESELRYPGFAMEVVHRQLEPLGFVSHSVRNEPNPDGEMPPWCRDRSGS